MSPPSSSDVRAVELGRGDELLEADLGAVQVGGEEDRPLAARSAQRPPSCAAAPSVRRLPVVDVLPPLLALADLVPHPPGQALALGVDRVQQPLAHAWSTRAAPRRRGRSPPVAGHASRTAAGSGSRCGGSPSPWPAARRCGSASIASPSAASWPPATSCVAAGRSASIRSVVVSSTICSFCSSSSSTGMRDRVLRPAGPATSIVWQKFSRSTNTSISVPCSRWLEAVPRALHRDEQVPVDHVAAVLQQAAHALALLLRHDEVDVLGGAAEAVHQRARRGAVQPDAGRAHDPERDAAGRGRGHDRQGLGLQLLQDRPSSRRSPASAGQPAGHSIGICWKARLMSMPWRLRYALAPRYQAVPTISAPRVIHELDRHLGRVDQRAGRDGVVPEQIEHDGRRTPRRSRPRRA